MAKSKDKDKGRENKSKKRRREEKEEERSPPKPGKKSSNSSNSSAKKGKSKSSNRAEEAGSSRDRDDTSGRRGRSSSRDNRNSKKKEDRSKSKKRKKGSSREHGSEKKKEKSISKKKKAGGNKDGDLEAGEGKEQKSVQAEIQIGEKDYFTRATEFKVWLLHKKKKYFEDLTSTESHELFEKFVKDWNRGKLDIQFYEGRLPDELIARTKKTQHKWGFVKNLSDRDQMQLELTNDSVHSSTEKVKGVASNVPVLPVGSIVIALPGGDKRANQGSSGGGDGDGEGGRHGGGGGRNKTEVKRQRRLEREKHAVVLDEIAPKETGRQATADKRREVGARTHAAAKAREDAADGLDMREADTMGGGDSFHEALARVKSGKDRRQTAKTEHLQGLAAKEAEKRAAFMAQMGLKAGQKITIQPRTNG